MLKNNPVEQIHEALSILELPVLTSMKELKTRYRAMVKKYHHDIVDSEHRMIQINKAYDILKHYMETYKFSFSEEEILKQFPEQEHANRFRF